MELTNKQETLVKELIDLGTELESIEYNRKFTGYAGFSSADLGYQRKLTRAKALRRIHNLKSDGVDPWDLDYTFTDESGIEWELGYALQFI